MNRSTRVSGLFAVISTTALLLLAWVVPSLAAGPTRALQADLEFAQSDDPIDQLDGKVKRLLREYQPPVASPDNARPAPATRLIDLASTSGVLQVCLMPAPPHNPSTGEPEPYCIVDSTLSVWGRASGGTMPFSWRWDFGDGTPSCSGVANVPAEAMYIVCPHRYSTLETFHAKLVVTDAASATDSASVEIAVAQDLLENRTNAAIQSGLAWLYRNQLSDGRWTAGYGSAEDVSGTGAALLAFHLNQHFRDNDRCADIYSGSVAAAIDFLLAQAVVTPIASGVYPDFNGNGKAIALAGSLSGYSQGFAMMGLAASGTTTLKHYVAPSGPAAGDTVRVILEDAADQCYMAQSKQGGYRGGWRYYINRTDGDADNSVTQWPTLGLLALKDAGIPIAQRAVDELAIWTNYSHCLSGGGFFGYVASGYGVCGWCNQAKAASGLIQLSLEGKHTQDAAVDTTLKFMASRWLSAGDCRGIQEHFNGNLYAMYSVAKSLRTVTDSLSGHKVKMVGTHDWEAEYQNHLLYDSTWKQASDGSWTAGLWVGKSGLSTAFAVLVLTPAVVQCLPVADGRADPNPVACEHTPVHFDGTASHSQCQGYHIVDWRWDWDISNGVDWNNPDATGAIVENTAGYAIPPGGGTVTAALQVTDDYPQAPGAPPRTAVKYIQIVLSDVNNPPVACLRPGCASVPPYGGKVGEQICLDGSYSYDPDVCRGDSVAQYLWDLGGIGVFVPGGKTACVVSNSVRQWQVGLKVCDTHGACSVNAIYVYVYAAEKNLHIDSTMVRLAPPCPVPCGLATLTIEADVRLETEGSLAADIRPATVDFFDGPPNSGGVYIGSQPLPSGMLLPQVFHVSQQWTVVNPGVEHVFYVKVDPSDQVPEWNETDNLAWVRQTQPPPPCSQGRPSIAEIWPPDHRMVDVSILGITSASGGPVTITITGITQDEPLDWLGDGHFESDGAGVNTSTAQLRAERSGTKKLPGNGRVYRISFRATDASGAACDSFVTVCVPHDMGQGRACIDDGQKYDSTGGSQRRIGDVLSFRVEQYPNPFNPSTTISYTLPEDSPVRVTVYNALGQQIRVLLSDDVQTTGSHSVAWDGLDGAGRRAPSGVYLYRVKAGRFEQTKRMLLMK